MAAALPAGVNDTIAPRLLIPCGIIIGITLPIYGARIYYRSRSAFGLSWDDYTISAAELLSTIGFGLQIASCARGLGRYSAFVSPLDASKAKKYYIIAGCISIFAVAFVRISVAFTLLRLKDSLQSKGWRWVLWASIAVQALCAVVAEIIQLNTCHPLRAVWENVQGAQCFSPLGIHLYSYIYSGISATNDILLSLMPLTFIWKMHRSLHERILVGFLMTLGLVASSATIFKMSYLTLVSPAEDPLRKLLTLTTWCKIEEVVGILAACLPVLKAPVERLLRMVGVLDRDVRRGFVFSLRSLPVGEDVGGGGAEEGRGKGDWMSHSEVAQVFAPSIPSVSAAQDVVVFSEVGIDFDTGQVAIAPILKLARNSRVEFDDEGVGGGVGGRERKVVGEEGNSLAAAGARGSCYGGYGRCGGGGGNGDEGED
ncbi:hypothetical protein G7Y89_g3798 [Cudoniella acicularis]|uniref:Rhodopsin domain-containing protein n=1 Tax=Cudoniella acicularis TaxID=354080 RepID=A0A8H4RQN6_9HELO|nr:hypothetical protein G7Y89_g3798 [Cudoniella acicularis]